MVLLIEPTETLVAQVKRHALANYSNGGWDVIVECWGDDDIRAAIGDAATLERAIARMAEVVDVYADRQADADHYADPLGGALCA
jgi:hypothetical protein